MTKSLRNGRIFLDYLRNDRMATAVAPLSPRARPGATVSMPLSWSQVKADLDPKRFTIRTVPGLLAKNSAWKDYCEGLRNSPQQGIEGRPRSDSQVSGRGQVVALCGDNRKSQAHKRGRYREPVRRLVWGPGLQRLLEP
jgi:hypothetical protein